MMDNFDISARLIPEKNENPVIEPCSEEREDSDVRYLVRRYTRDEWSSASVAGLNCSDCESKFASAVFLVA